MQRKVRRLDIPTKSVLSSFFSPLARRSDGDQGSVIPKCPTWIPPLILCLSLFHPNIPSTLFWPSAGLYLLPRRPQILHIAPSNDPIPQDYFVFPYCHICRSVRFVIGCSEVDEELFGIVGMEDGVEVGFNVESE